MILNKLSGANFILSIVQDLENKVKEKAVDTGDVTAWKMYGC